MVTNADDIIVIAESAAVAAIKEYESISKSDTWNMPEYWITCRIASDLARKGMRVECEKRIGTLIDTLIPDNVERMIGRVDLAIYNDVTDARDQVSSLKGLIEVKGPRTAWLSFPADFERLRTIAKLLDTSGLLVGLVYGTPPMTEKRLNSEEETMKRLFTAEILGREKTELLKVSQRHRLQCHHSDRTPGYNDAWEIISIFDRT